jgi:hypothetical protein
MSKEMSIRELELRARIIGGSEVLLAIDRLACPMPGPESAKRMKSGMMTLQKWTESFSPEQRQSALIAVGKHVKSAVEIMKQQQQQQQG